MEYIDYKPIMNALRNAKKPLIVAGQGIRHANCEQAFKDFVNTLRIPVVCTWGAQDLFHYDEELYIGNIGVFGERTANHAIQNADLLLILGARMTLPCIGYAHKLFSPNSHKIMVDIDPDEMGKSTIKIDRKICCDLGAFFNFYRHDGWTAPLVEYVDRSVFDEPHVREEGKINAYDFIRELSKHITDEIIVTDSGSAYTVTNQALRCTGRNRLISSHGTNAMGFGLPAAIGAWFASKRKIILIAGDGGFQMNIQELQTVVQYNIPLKIFVLNSNGYLAISLMQDNLFEGKHFGATADTGVRAPRFCRIADAYGMEVFELTDTGILAEVLSSLPAPFLCEIDLPYQQMIPRVQSRKDANGQIVAGSLDEMYP